MLQAKEPAETKAPAASKMGPPAAGGLSLQPEVKSPHENALLALAVRKKQLEKMIFSLHKLLVLFCDLSVLFMLRMFLTYLIFGF